jgi:hypothetical protein
MEQKFKIGDRVIILGKSIGNYTFLKHARKEMEATGLRYAIIKRKDLGFGGYRLYVGHRNVGLYAASDLKLYKLPIGKAKWL